MPERHPGFTPPARRLVSKLVGVLLIATSVVVAACTEKLDGGASCPSLCPGQVASFRDTTFEGTVTDTSVGDFPTLGLAEYVLVANRKDTIETRGVVRFDVLPTNFFPNKGTDTATITAVDSVYLQVLVDSTAGKGTTPVTLQLFDVDTTANDTVAAVVKSLYRADRLIGGLELTPKNARDTLRIPVSKTFLLAKIKAGAKIRIGLRFAGTTSAQLRFLAFSSGLGAPALSFDVPTDTLYTPIHVTPSTVVVDGDPETQLAYTVYTLTDRGTPIPPSPGLSIGGWPAKRIYFRFSVPRHILDSSTIVRAELLLTQRPSNGVDPGDTIVISQLIGTATDIVTDLRRAAELTAEGSFNALDSLRLAPGDSGLKVLNVANQVRTWKSLAANVPPVIVLRSRVEGSRASQVLFFNTKGATSLRPRIRITYLPRSEFAIP